MTTEVSDLTSKTTFGSVTYWLSMTYGLKKKMAQNSLNDL